jgi:hypothetical protein
MEYLDYKTEEQYTDDYIYLVPQTTGNYMSFVGNPDYNDLKPSFNYNDYKKLNKNNDYFIFKFYVASISIIMLYIFYILYNKYFYNL